MRSEHGFSLLELLIVLVVIALIAAIAVPNLLAARRAANEGASVSALRTLYSANVSYASTTGNGSYAGTAGSVGISSLTDLATANLIDGVLGTGYRASYAFVGDRAVATATQPESFYFATNPAISTGLLLTGTKRFGVATDGVIHLDATPANLGTPFDAATLAAAPTLAN